jgi:hypothetical protein
VTGVITQIVDALGQQLNNLLENAQQRPLEAGKILIGREHVSDSASAPQVVMIPSTSRFGPAGINPSTFAAVDAQGRKMRLRSRPLWTESLTFECHVWADTETFSATDPARGFNAAQFLSHTLLRSAYLIMTANCRPTRGAWGDQATDKPNLIISGHYMVVGLEIDIPVTDQALIFVPQGTVMGRPNINFTTPGGD